jgi:hypothetical protein
MEVFLRNAPDLGAQDLASAQQRFKADMLTIFGSVYCIHAGYAASLGSTESAKDWRAKTALAHAKVREAISHKAAETLRLGQAGGAFFQISITQKA